MTPTPTPSSRRYSPLGQMVLARLREFYREPVAVFWVYGFPILMMIALGIAFRDQPTAEKITVDVERNADAEQVVAALPADKFIAEIHDAEVCKKRLRTGKTDVIVRRDISAKKPTYHFLLDPNRPGSLLAKDAVNDALQTAAGRTDPAVVEVKPFEEPGGRYIDFLVPGMLGMNLMGGGLWGVGFVIVDMRIRKLLKRFLATPMKRGHFLAAVMLSRLCFMIPEMIVLLLFGWLGFGVAVRGSILAVMAIILLGAFTFAGIGLLIASRAQTLETVSGLMNLAMLPMWILSGIFFSSARFPEVVQPFIKALPLTPLIDSLRAVMLEGEPLTTQLPRLGILAAWAVGSFALALRWFRWN